MLNRFDRPATMRTRATMRAKLDNPIADIAFEGNCEQNALAVLERIRQTFLACDAGRHRGPLEITTPHFFAVCCESREQRDALRTAMRLANHGEQYWAGAAVDGTLGMLKSGGSGRTFAKRANPFAKAAPPPAAKEVDENAEKYSRLRAEAKKTAEKMALYTEDRTWIAVCFPDDKAMAAFRRKWGLPDGKYVHVDDFAAALCAKGIKIEIPAVEFALRAEAKPDKALNALIG